MRTAFPKTLIGLLALVFALCGQNVPGQNSQTQPAPQPADTQQPSTQQPSAQQPSAQQPSAKKPSTQQKHPETSPGAEAGKGAGRHLSRQRREKDHNWEKTGKPCHEKFPPGNPMVLLIPADRKP